MREDRFTGLVAFVTGAGGAIGGAAARGFAKEGAKVVVVDFNPVGGQKTVDDIKEAGGEAIFIQANVGLDEECEKAVKIAYDTYGKIDILNNNVGLISRYFPEEMPDTEWDKIVPVNGKSYYNFMRLIVPKMAEQGKGAVVNTASLAAIKGGDGGESIYAFCKAGIVAMTAGYAQYYARKGVRLNCISPGLTPTNLNKGTAGMEEIIAHIPCGRAGRPEDQANAIMFLASDEADWITGKNLAVDGGDFDGIF